MGPHGAGGCARSRLSLLRHQPPDRHPAGRRGLGPLLEAADPGAVPTRHHRVRGVHGCGGAPRSRTVLDVDDVGRRPGHGVRILRTRPDGLLGGARRPRATRQRHRAVAAQHERHPHLRPVARRCAGRLGALRHRWRLSGRRSHGRDRHGDPAPSVSASSRVDGRLDRGSTLQPVGGDGRRRALRRRQTAATASRVEFVLHRDVRLQLRGVLSGHDRGGVRTSTTPMSATSARRAPSVRWRCRFRWPAGPVRPGPR